MRVEVGAAVEPMVGQSVSGDAIIVVETEETLLAGIVDGLGHGPVAAEVAATFRSVVERLPRSSPEVILAECDRSLFGTRGAVAGLLRVELASRRLSFAGVGNTTFVAKAAIPMHVVSLPGILGRLRRARPVRFDFQLSDGDLVALHSDGVSSVDLRDADGRSLSDFAREVIDGRGREDDRSCVVLRIASET
ncbi:MAG: SpoIIE family protein phosphatase [Deltaproteobacteria bacterium]|nr:SpoIIE family protein phosphatase [Deltaproteobacteria bacterium]